MIGTLIQCTYYKEIIQYLLGWRTEAIYILKRDTRRLGKDSLLGLED